MAVKCPSCGAARLVRDTRDIPYICKGKTTTICAVRGDFCPACGESVLSTTQSSRVSAAMLESNSSLETMLDPVTRAIANAPVEDEEISEEERHAVAEAHEWLKHNKPIPHEEVLAEFGLTMDDCERMGRTPLPPESNGTDR